MLKKYVLLPLMLFVYISIIKIFFVPGSYFYGTLPMGNISGGTAQTVGLGNVVTIYVERPYFFGLYRLPVQIGALKLGHIHSYFLWFLFFLFVIFALYDINKIGGENHELETTRY